MKTRNNLWLAGCSILLGTILTLLAFRAAAQPRSASPQQSGPVANFQVVAYGNGGTGIFDPATGRLYVYDASLVNCIMVRQVSTLGEPLVRLRN